MKTSAIYTVLLIKQLQIDISNLHVSAYKALQFMNSLSYG